MPDTLLNIVHDEHDAQRLAAWLVASVLLHGLLLAAFGSVPGAGPAEGGALPVIDVVLSGVPAPAGAGGRADSPPRQPHLDQARATTPVATTPPAPPMRHRVAQTQQAQQRATAPHVVAAHRALPAHAPRVLKATMHNPGPAPSHPVRQRAHPHVHKLQAAAAAPPPVHRLPPARNAPQRTGKPVPRTPPRRLVFTHVRKTVAAPAPAAQPAPSPHAQPVYAPARPSRTSTQAPAASRAAHQDAGARATPSPATAARVGGRTQSHPATTGVAKGATARSVSGGSGAAGRGGRRSLAALAALLHAAIAARQHYPAMARRLGREGVATVRFTLHPDGAMDGVTLEHSSGFAALDKAALLAVTGVAPFAPAARYLDGVRQFTVQVVFRLF